MEQNKKRFKEIVNNLRHDLENRIYDYCKTFEKELAKAFVDTYAPGKYIEDVYNCVVFETHYKEEDFFCEYSEHNRELVDNIRYCVRQLINVYAQELKKLAKVSSDVFAKTYNPHIDYVNTFDFMPSYMKGIRNFNIVDMYLSYYIRHSVDNVDSDIESEEMLYRYEHDPEYPYLDNADKLIDLKREA